MNTFFSNFNRIVLVAGHGNQDAGALSSFGHKESEQNIFIVNKIAQELSKRSLRIDVCPHNLDLQGAIQWINNNYFSYDPNRKDNSWVIEIHRDWNNLNLPQEQRDNQIGIYYFDENRDRKEGFNDGISIQIAKTMIQKYLKLGAYKGDVDLFNFNGSWIKDHFLDWAGYYLGFIELTKPLAHIIEHGFMSGRNDEEHLTKLANWSAQVIYETFTGKEYTNENIENLDFNTRLARTYMKNLDNLRKGEGQKWWNNLPDDIKRAFDSTFDPCFVAMKIDELLKK